MDKRDTWKEQLAEYTAALEKQRSNGDSADHAVEYLEHQVLHLQTKSLLASLPHHQEHSKGKGQLHRLFTHLNPWHPDFHLWTFVIALGVWMLAALLCRILLGV